jgi:ATP-dependent exoDNAse (exonuclease V) beta subunit
MTLADQPARDRIRHDLGATLVVEAAAGTGKTTELVKRIMALVESGEARLSEIVAVTFTDRAGGEMKLRLRQAIEQSRKGTTGAAREVLDRALADLETARIGTIHSFCADLLREVPVAAGIDPLFEVAAGQAAHRLFIEAFEEWLGAALRDPPEGVRRILRRRFARRAPSPRELLRRAAKAMLERRDFDAPWRRQPFDRDALIDDLVVELAALGSLANRAEHPEDWLARSFLRVRELAVGIEHRESVAARDYDGLEAELSAAARERYWEWKGRPSYTQFASGLARTDVLDQRARVKALLDDFRVRAEADLAATLDRDLRDLIPIYDAAKARAGKLDFLDLLLRTRTLVRDDRDVRADLQGRFRRILVDEFQDTDPLQAEILLLLAADSAEESNALSVRPEAGKLFLVGDPKQSIYRFRRADISLYQRVKAQLVSAGGTVVHLTTSFRSAPSIQSAINATFAPAMEENPRLGQTGYVPLNEYRTDPEGQPAVVALPAPEIYGAWGRPSIHKGAISDSYPDVVGAFVHWLLQDSGWQVEEKDAGRVAMADRHVCLLFKRFQSFGEDLTGPYRRALEARQIPHVLVGGRSFYDREEVRALTNALTAIEWPEDELSVYATLRGPFFGLGDDALLLAKQTWKHLDPTGERAPVASGLLQPVAELLDLLCELHRFRNQRPIADTVSHLLEAGRAHAGMAIWPSGEQALANVARLLDHSRRFEATGGYSFRAFVQRLVEEAEEGVTAEAPAVEEGTEGVRIMNVHQAKGLEFPVVILCDPGAPMRPRNPSRWMEAESHTWVEPVAGLTPIELIENGEVAIEQDCSETLRVAYVAATRARDLLVVPVIGDWRGNQAQIENSWLQVLEPAVYPAAHRRRQARPATGCPEFQATECVRNRPGTAYEASYDTVMPGAHDPQVGEHEVVWWSPLDLELDVRTGGGLRSNELLVAGAGGASGHEAAHEAWVARQEALHASGIQLGLRLSRMTDNPGGQLERSGEVGDIEVVDVGLDRSARPGGRRLGSLVHLVLAAIDLDAGTTAVQRYVEVYGRTVGATEPELDEACRCVEAALRQDLYRRARAATRVARELPLVLRLDDGTLSEGTADLAFREPEGWQVVELKTDAALGPRAQDYRMQLCLYVRAVAVATGEPTTGSILWL